MSTAVLSISILGTPLSRVDPFRTVYTVFSINSSAVRFRGQTTKILRILSCSPKRGKTDIRTYNPKPPLFRFFLLIGPPLLTINSANSCQHFTPRTGHGLDHLDNLDHLRCIITSPYNALCRIRTVQIQPKKHVCARPYWYRLHIRLPPGNIRCCMQIIRIM